jgi:hypothetical protein
MNSGIAGRSLHWPSYALVPSGSSANGSECCDEILILQTFSLIIINFVRQSL